MKKSYVYEGTTFSTEQGVRQAIFEKERKAFGKAPLEDAVDFWSKFGVEYIEEQESIETLQSWKLNAIKNAFLIWREHNATLISSLGFKADSNERAMSDVSGLLVAYEDKQDELITFRDADNEFHSLTYTQVKTLQKEIIANGNHAYSQKWALDAQVGSATTKEELDAIEVKFEGKNFLEE